MSAANPPATTTATQTSSKFWNTSIILPQNGTAMVVESARLKISPPDAPSQPAESRPGRPTKDETAELRAELEAMLVDLRKRMIATRSVFMLLGGGAAILFFLNWQLAVALLPFAAIFGFLYFRNAKAVALLENGL